MADKEVKIKVATESDLSGVKPIEAEINKLKQQKIQLDIQTNTARLEEVNSKIESTKAKLSELKGKADVDDAEVKQLETELDRLESEKIDLQLAIETGKLDAAKMEIEALDGTTIDVDVNNISAMEAVDQIGQGFDRLKQGASEVGQQLGSVLESAGRMEQTEAFLSMNMGADQAKQKLEEIRSVTDKLPGDDVALQNLLSQSVLKDASMTTDAFQQMGSAAADYMAAMQNFGKTSTETQQDLMNYILAGNTAEIERSPILQSHIDKLKEGTTVQERAKLLQEALTEEGWNGISQQDTYNNKLQTFNDMIERGKMNLGGMFQEGAKAGMDFLLQLDNASGGLVGMGIALAQFASPITDVVMGLGQIATGLNALKDAGDLLGLKDKFNSLKITLNNLRTSITSFALDVKNVAGGAFNSLKTSASSALTTIRTTATGAFTSLKSALVTVASSARTAAASAFTSLRTGLTNVATAARGAATSLISAGRAALTSAANAIRSAAMWAAEKAAKIASTAASYAMAAAQAVLNFVMSMNPIVLVVMALIALAAALIWAYNNVDWFREMIDNAWASIQAFAGWLSGAFMGAINAIGDAFNNAGQTIQSSIQGAVDFVMGALQGLWTYITTLGGLIPENASITGNSIIDTALKVIGFLITLPLQLQMIFINMIAKALGFGDNFAQTMLQGAADAVGGFLSWITQLPAQVGESLAAVVEGTINWLTQLWESITEITLLIADALAFPFVNIGMIVYQSLMTIWSVITGILASVWASIMSFGLQLQTTVTSVVSFVINGLQRGVAYFATLPGVIGGYLSNVLSRVISWGSSIVSNFLSAASRSVSNFGSQIAQIPQRLGAELSSALDKVNEWAATLPQKFWDAGVNAVKNFLSALGIASPGTMQRMLVWEVTEMGRRIPYESRDLLSNVKELGTNIVDSFGNPTLSVGSDISDMEFSNSAISSSNQTPINQTFNFEIGSIDNEDRINEIVEIIRRELNWNNRTAGRTV